MSQKELEIYSHADKLEFYVNKEKWPIVDQVPSEVKYKGHICKTFSYK